MFRINAPLLVVVGLSLFAPVAFAQDADITSRVETAPINELCPVTGDEPADPRFTVEYKGIAIGLCCRKCRTKFEADPEAYVANIPGFEAVSFSLGVQPDVGHDDGQTHDHAEADPQHEDDADHADDGAIVDDGTDHENGHDHDVDHADSGLKIVSWLGKFHPPATHLPIGLLIGAALSELGLMLTRREMFRHATAFCLGLAALGALGAATLGWFNGGFVLFDEDWVQGVHRWLGTSVAVFSVVAFAVLIRTSRKTPEQRTPFRVVLFLTATLVGATGFFGGALVYGLNHYAW
ncbi:MAG: hypothetical protein Q9O74_07745 [Planctomycetota bacterium]|nr:hypothetical protein [Planctomycetota bacterium]